MTRVRTTSESVHPEAPMTAISPEKVGEGKGRPIIFSTPMVRALLDGRKTQTRQLIRDTVPEAPGMDCVSPHNTIRHAAPYLDAYCSQKRTPDNPRGMGDWWCWWTRDDRACPQFRVGYRPGDRLWVREAWAFVDGEHRDAIAFRADCEGQSDAWRSPIFMPRALSRLTLIVETVNVERLQGISEEDAIAEGLRPDTCGGQRMWDPGPPHGHFGDPRLAFRFLWSDLHGLDTWGANPWVAALTFRAIPKNIDSLANAPACDDPTKTERLSDQALSTGEPA